MRGFAPILIVVLVAVAAIGGYFVYTSLRGMVSEVEPDVAISPTIQTPTPTTKPESTSSAETANWKTYTNIKHKFSLKYPTDWKYVEVPTPTYQTQNDEIWFLPQSSPLPPPQTDARADVVFVFTSEDTSSNWQPQYFNNYKTESYQLGNVSAKKITGINKGGLNQEMVIIADVGDFYLQVFSNYGEVSLQYFDQILSTFRFE